MTRSLEQKLIEAAVAGDKEAAGKLIRAHQGSLYAFLLRLSGDPDMAEDVVQDAFVRVLMHLDRFDPRYRFSTWLFTIAKRLYVNAVAKKKPRFDSELVGSWRSSMPTPSAPAIDSERREAARDAVQFALTRLSDVQREIILLFHQQSWPIVRIAAHLEMPEGTIKSHLHRGRRRMLASLRQVDRHAVQIPAMAGDGVQPGEGKSAKVFADLIEEFWA